MDIRRDFYLNQLIAGRENGLIKIITGIRRCGKSYLLFRLFHEWLNANGIENNHIIEVALDDRSNKELRDPDALLNYVKSRITDNNLHYILLDEIQIVPEFTDVLNSLLHIRNADVYVTGSNSHFLSTDVVTEFRGRGDEIRLHPLSFAEFCQGFQGEKNQAWKEYYTYGGLPLVLSLDTEQKKTDYLTNLYQSVYLVDILERHKIKNKAEFDELVKTMASSIGSPCNPTKLSNTFKYVQKCEESGNPSPNHQQVPLVLERCVSVGKGSQIRHQGEKIHQYVIKILFLRPWSPQCHTWLPATGRKPHHGKYHLQ